MEVVGSFSRPLLISWPILPKIGGSIRHVADVLVTYFDSEHSDEKTLITYIARFGNRTIYKRSGYLIETLGISAPHVIELCREYLSAAYVF